VACAKNQLSVLDYRVVAAFLIAASFIFYHFPGGRQQSTISRAE